MPNLKEYWDHLSPSTTDSTDIEYGIAGITDRIRKEQHTKRLIVAVVCILPIIAICIFTVRPLLPTAADTLQCYAPLGERHSVTLSDGTTVTLNSGSTLIYPDRYDRKVREVILIGEAKFEVSKNPHRPFIVKTQNFDVQVLGTVFNVDAYPEDRTPSVTLESGSVRILRDDEEFLLIPGQMATLDETGGFSIEQVDVSRSMLWTNGGFAFKQASISDICNYIEQTYGMNVQCNTRLAKYRETSITARRDTQLPLDDFLTLCSDLIPGMHYHIENNIITLN
jgi:transmembrane sensor